MNPIQPKPYKLFNTVQNYEWGTKNEEAFIPKFLGIEAEKDLPYAELWIGAHPKASSEIELDGKKIKLIDAINKYPVEILGKKVIEKFGKQLPFLLKILSASKALSIQLHPGKDQAKKLHALNPQNYPDANHKPEVAIAIDSLKAIAGFRPAIKIKENFVKYPELAEIVGKEVYAEVINEDNETKLQEKIKRAYSSIMMKAEKQSEIDSVISKLITHLSSTKNLSQEEEQFLAQQKLYGNDVGLLSFFFFNMIDLKPGEAIFADAGIPHAYLKGNIIECMANSDNVVRAGLTPKFKDVKTLLEIMNYNCVDFEVLNSNPNEAEVIYKTPAQEFEVSSIQNTAGFEYEIYCKGKPVVFLIEEGNVNVSCSTPNAKNQQTFIKGDSFICPALVDKIHLSSREDTKYIVVSIPD